jgi:hypothetical protein
MRRDSSKAIATDSEGHELRVNDNVKEVDGEVSAYLVYILNFICLQGNIGQKRTCPPHPSVVLCFPA